MAKEQQNNRNEVNRHKNPPVKPPVKQKVEPKEEVKNTSSPPVTPPEEGKEVKEKVETQVNETAQPKPETKPEIKAVQDKPKVEEADKEEGQEEPTFKELQTAFNKAYQELYTMTAQLALRAKQEGVPTSRRIVQFEKSLKRNGTALRIKLPSKFKTTKSA